MRSSSPAHLAYLLLLGYLLLPSCHLETHGGSPHRHLGEGHRRLPPESRVRIALPDDGTLSFLFEPPLTAPVDGLKLTSADGISATFNDDLARYQVPLATLSRHAIVNQWSFQLEGYETRYLQLGNQSGKQLVDTLLLEPTSRVAIEHRILSIRKSIPTSKVFDCASDFDLDGRSPASSTPEAGPDPEIAAMRTQAQARRDAKVLEHDLASAERVNRRAFLEAEIERLNKAIGSTLMSGMGQITGQARSGYFVHGAVLPIATNESIVTHKHVVLQGPFFVSGNQLDVVGNVALMPTPLVYRGLMPASNAFGARMMVPSYSSDITARQRNLIAQLETNSKSLSVLKKEEFPQTPDLSKEDLEIAIADALQWRQQWCR